MTEELKPCFCGRMPELMKYTSNGENHVEYMCDQSIDEYLPHVLLADNSVCEEGARQNWNMVIGAIEKRYRKGGQQ
ncbi:hypothetical protein [Akkermansia muciniphila]|uniref:hypothetical protein n=1 Tax=Akkermansia muciniphila TaxID=239935 RepID=UPI0011AFB7CE|nr:hypothetical protein [Akkermansia muciniphila]